MFFFAPSAEIFRQGRSPDGTGRRLKPAATYWNLSERGKPQESSSTECSSSLAVRIRVLTARQGLCALVPLWYMNYPG